MRVRESCADLVGANLRMSGADLAGVDLDEPR